MCAPWEDNLRHCEGGKRKSFKCDEIKMKIYTDNVLCLLWDEWNHLCRFFEGFQTPKHWNLFTYATSRRRWEANENVSAENEICKLTFLMEIPQNFIGEIMKKNREFNFRNSDSGDSNVGSFSGFRKRNWITLFVRRIVVWASFPASSRFRAMMIEKWTGKASITMINYIKAHVLLPPFCLFNYSRRTVWILMACTICTL